MANDRVAKLERLLATDPADAFVLYGLAQEYARAGDAARAVEFYDRCLAADPSYCYAYYHKAQALIGASRAREAAEALRAGIRAAKTANDPKALSELTALLDQLE